MNVLLSTIGRRAYLARYFKALLSEMAIVVGTSDRASIREGYPVGFIDCDRCYILPSILDDDYVSSVLDICIREKIGLITSLFDLDCLVLSRHISEFERIGVCAVLSDQRVNEICSDKLQTHDFLERNGFLTPATFSTVEEVLKAKPDFPVIVKPRHGFSSKGITRRVYSREELVIVLQENSDLIVQEFIDYPEYGLDIFNDRDHVVISSVVKRKIEMRAGETDQAITVKVPDLLELGVKLGESLGHFGPLDVDLLLTPEGPKIIDLNARFGGGYPLSHAAGVDFPSLMLKLARAERLLPAIGNYEEGLVMLKAIDPVFLPIQELDAKLHRVSVSHS